MSGLATRLSQFYLLAFVGAIPIFFLLLIENAFNPSNGIFDAIRLFFAIFLLLMALKPRLVSSFPKVFGNLTVRQEKIILLSGLFFVLSAARAATDVGTFPGLLMAISVVVAVVLIGITFILIIFDK